METLWGHAQTASSSRIFVRSRLNPDWLQEVWTAQNHLKSDFCKSDQNHTRGGLKWDSNLIRTFWRWCRYHSKPCRSTGTKRLVSVSVSVFCGVFYFLNVLIPHLEGELRLSPQLLWQPLFASEKVHLKGPTKCAKTCFGIVLHLASTANTGLWEM